MKFPVVRIVRGKDEEHTVSSEWIPLEKIEAISSGEVWFESDYIMAGGKWYECYNGEFKVLDYFSNCFEGEAHDELEENEQDR